ncbi:MAG: class I SAM-dependent methyltransferase [Deltaproteobacteria bacterium]|nr:class I SAM-dependent methyltransferase [Deltaproteobacteria bacterium]
MEDITCPLCGAYDAALLFTRKDHTYRISNQPFNVVRCRRCSLVYVNPRPTENHIHHYYPDDFYSVNLDKDALLRDQDRQLKLKWKYVSHLRPGKLIDIGCMKGEFLNWMQQRGWEVQGVEFSSKPPNVFNLDICYKNLVESDLPANSFDLVTLWAVLEHVYHPRAMLRQVWRVLKPGGTIVLLVTNINSLPGRLMRHDDIPRHTILFSERTLTRMLQRTGFVSTRVMFNCRLFGGSNRGLLNYLVKLAAGERMEYILSQNRDPNRWHEFSRQVRGRDYPWMKWIDKADIALTPWLDRMFDRLHLGFIMLAEARKPD